MIEGTNRRRRPLLRWKDKVKEYVSERGVRGNGLEYTRRVYGLGEVILSAVPPPPIIPLKH